MQGRAEKEKWAKNFTDKFSKAQLSILVSYRGLKAVDADLIRKKVRDNKGELKVLKNNVARKAVESGSHGTAIKESLDGVVGPTMIIFGNQDVAALAKVVYDFSKDNEAFTLKEGIFANQRIKASDVEALAKLPPKPVLLAQLLGVLNGPARSFVSVLAAVPRGLVTVLKAVEDKKRSAGEN